MVNGGSLLSSLQDDKQEQGVLLKFKSLENSLTFSSDSVLPTTSKLERSNSPLDKLMSLEENRCWTTNFANYLTIINETKQDTYQSQNKLICLFQLQIQSEYPTLSYSYNNFGGLSNNGNT